ncbi:exopolysaccharide biosynthesis protein [Aestuariibacter sp. GS-14]|uniref:exopolysaccharide biosynthesis protein n=1 Tax=Aestuariibacter sp. GS-14 TaxID=2590670 RepID=UPI0021042F26|nr:exopolysaccharide biosynthesis protein [Aestuariibacter sp. GS-14]
MSRQSHHLFDVPAAKRSRTSDILLSIARQGADHSLSLGTLATQFGDRTFGILLIFLAIINIVPIISIISGLLIVFLGVQMILGMRRAWLPASVMHYQLNPVQIQKALNTFHPSIVKLEYYIRPRWQFCEAPIVDRINGVAITVFGMATMIPIPLTNLPPALFIILMGLGLLERDGLVQVAAAFFGLLVTSLLGYLILM